MEEDIETLNCVLKMERCYNRDRQSKFLVKVRVWLNGRVGECGADIIMVVPGHSIGGASSVWDEIKAL